MERPDNIHVYDCNSFWYTQNGWIKGYLSIRDSSVVFKPRGQPFQAWFFQDVVSVVKSTSWFLVKDAVTMTLRDQTEVSFSGLNDQGSFSRLSDQELVYALLDCLIKWHTEHSKSRLHSPSKDMAVACQLISESSTDKPSAALGTFSRKDSPETTRAILDRAQQSGVAAAAELVKQGELIDDSNRQMKTFHEELSASNKSLHRIEAPISQFFLSLVRFTTPSTSSKSEHPQPSPPPRPSPESVLLEVPAVLIQEETMSKRIKCCFTKDRQQSFLFCDADEDHVFASFKYDDLFHIRIVENSLRLLFMFKTAHGTFELIAIWTPYVGQILTMLVLRMGLNRSTLHLIPHPAITDVKVDATSSTAPHTTAQPMLTTRDLSGAIREVEVAHVQRLYGKEAPTSTGSSSANEVGTHQMQEQEQRIPEMNIDEVSKYVSSLKMLASDISNELDRQQASLSALESGVDRNEAKISGLQGRITKLL